MQAGEGRGKLLHCPSFILGALLEEQESLFPRKPSSFVTFPFLKLGPGDGIH